MNIERLSFTEEHMDALREVLQATVRAELLRIFEERPGTTMEGLDGAVLRYLSRISKVHEENAIGNKVDQALSNAFDIYRKVHELEEKHIRKVVYDMLLQYKQETIRKMNETIIYP